jgi:P2-related tail formation protein
VQIASTWAFQAQDDSAILIISHMETITKIFRNHNLSNSNPEAELISFELAISLYNAGVWEKTKHHFIVRIEKTQMICGKLWGFPVFVSDSLPSPRRGVSKNGLKHRKGTHKRG